MSCGVGVRRLCVGGRKEKETAGGVGGSRVTHFTNPNGMEENQTQHGVTGYMESEAPDTKLGGAQAIPPRTTKIWDGTRLYRRSG